MPIREYACQNRTCSLFDVLFERYERLTDPPPCPVCQCQEMMKQMISAPNVVFAGAITSRYNDKKLEGAHQEGQWMYEKKAPGGPKWTFAEDWGTRKRIIKQEGLVEAGQSEITADGRSVSTNGMPGRWI